MPNNLFVGSSRSRNGGAAEPSGSAFALFALGKTMRALAAFAAFHALKSHHLPVMFFLFVATAGAALSVTAVQQPWNGKAIPTNKISKLVYGGLLLAATLTLWTLGLRECGPLRTLVMDGAEMPLYYLRSVWTKKEKPEKNRTRGTVLIMIAYLLLMFDATNRVPSGRGFLQKTKMGREIDEKIIRFKNGTLAKVYKFKESHMDDLKNVRHVLDQGADHKDEDTDPEFAERATRRKLLSILGEDEDSTEKGLKYHFASRKLLRAAVGDDEDTMQVPDDIPADADRGRQAGRAADRRTVPAADMRANGDKDSAGDDIATDERVKELQQKLRELKGGRADFKDTHDAEMPKDRDIREVRTRDQGQEDEDYRPPTRREERMPERMARDERMQDDRMERMRDERRRDDRPPRDEPGRGRRGKIDDYDEDVPAGKGQKEEDDYDEEFQQDDDYEENMAKWDYDVDDEDYDDVTDEYEDYEDAYDYEYDDYEEYEMEHELDAPRFKDKAKLVRGLSAEETMQYRKPHRVLGVCLVVASSLVTQASRGYTRHVASEIGGAKRFFSLSLSTASGSLLIPGVLSLYLASTPVHLSAISFGQFLLVGFLWLVFPYYIRSVVSTKLNSRILLQAGVVFPTLIAIVASSIFGYGQSAGGVTWLLILSFILSAIGFKLVMADMRHGPELPTDNKTSDKD